MHRTSLNLPNIKIPLLTLDAVVIGSGCAGFNAADWLHTLGVRDVALLTEGVNMGTSRNTGSDKQTYYKLSLASDGADSVASMAQTLFAGGGVHGDTALAEAAGSVRGFIKLCNLGVPFPTNEFGEYVGYKTDHDPRQRATSAGPLTSKFMTEALERSVRLKDVPILDGMSAVQLLTDGGRFTGLLCIDRAAVDSPTRGLTLVRAASCVLATGGPAGCYFTSVYPRSQTGMSGMALEAGVTGANLHEWQYGLASIQFRWNVSGTYQQVLPRYISLDANGVEREFLPDCLGSAADALGAVFLKGYQWPFDTAKVPGSSLVDIFVHHETVDLGRRVFLDYTRNPAGLENGFSALPAEARAYLENSGALQGTPIERLRHMNPPAIAHYRSHGIDLARAPLEIAVCAQHHNGGLAVDSDWQTGIEGLYAAGECAGTFGPYRPGGSALNSTQVGSMRAAEHIARAARPHAQSEAAFLAHAQSEAGALLARFEALLARADGSSSLRGQREEMQRAMSRCAAHIRDEQGMAALEDALESALDGYFEQARIRSPRELPMLMKNRDLFLTQRAVLCAMRAAARQCGSAGAALVTDVSGAPACGMLPALRVAPHRERGENARVETVRTEDGFASRFQPVRELPQPDGWFENVWADYRARMGMD